MGNIGRGGNRREGWRTEGGVEAGFDAAKSVSVPRSWCSCAFLNSACFEPHEEGTERKGEWRWREGGSEARGGSGNRCSHICSGPYLDLVGPFSTQLISSFLKERWGAYGGVGAVVDAATSVPVPTLV